MTKAIQLALLITIGVGLYAGPVQAHYPLKPDPKGGPTLDERHHRQHVDKGHAWAVVKHTRSYRALVWHRKALVRINRRLAVIHRQLEIRRYMNNPAWAICDVFGRYCQEAINVAACETGGTFSTSAQNGQYLGLFQMGDYARSRYGHSGSALGQARAAYRYFVDSGRDWSPWACKP